MKKPSLEQNMTRSLVSVRWNQSMREAKDLMEEHRIRHLPVMGTEGDLLGILSDRDINLALNPQSLRFKKRAVVGDYMNWPVLTVEQDSSIADVAQMMIEQKVSALVVTHGNVPAGIITSEDLLRLLESMLRDSAEAPGLLTSLAYQPIVREGLRQAEAAGL